MPDPQEEQQEEQRRKALQEREADRRRRDPYYTPQKQSFEVVCIKNGVSDGEAKLADFKRIPVEAESTYAAMNDPEVVKQAEGYRTLYPALPGVLTDVEILARQNELNMADGRGGNPYLDGPSPRR